MMEKRINLDQDWYFAKEKLATGAEVIKNGESVRIPHTYYQDGEYFQGTVTYYKELDLTDSLHAARYLRFSGVDKSCQVYFNGQKIGEHHGGYAAFTVRLPKEIQREQNELLVYVNNEAGATVSPLSGDFTRFGGIYREVELIVKDDVHFDPTFYGTCGLIVQTEVKDTSGLIHTQAHIVSTKSNEELKICYRVLDANGKEVLCYQTDLAPQSLLLPQVRLWNGQKDPYQYRLIAQLSNKDGVCDEVSLAIGFKQIAMDSEKGFFLNGAHLKIKGVAKHQDHPGVYSAVSREDILRDQQDIREIGANAVRLSHYQHPQYTYDLCNQDGLVVWAEIPLLKLTDSDELFENAKEQLKELIYQNCHHVSICFWGVQNEIAIFGEEDYMYEKIAKLHTLAKEIDPYRLTTAANLNTVPVESKLNQLTDIIAYNVYFGWYYGKMPDYEDFFESFHRVNPTVALGISEYGVDANPKFHSANPKVKDYSEEYQALFHETVYPYILNRDYIWGSFIWNMFDFVSAARDEGGTKGRNAKGLVSFDRRVKKDAFYYYKAVWSKEPFIQIAEKRFQKRHVAEMTVKVYSNLPSVTLEFDRKTYQQEVINGTAKFQITLNEGLNEVKAWSGTLQDWASFELVDAPFEAYVYKDPNPGLNVKNWFEDEVEKEKLFPTGFYSILDKVTDVLANEETSRIIAENYPECFAFLSDEQPPLSIERICFYKKNLLTSEEMRDLNAKLTKIRK